MNELNLTFLNSFVENGSNISDFNELGISLMLKYQRLSAIAALVAQTVIGSLLGIGLIGNSLVIYISATSDRIINQPVHSLLVVNLAVSDLVYLISSAPYQIFAFSKSNWIYGAFLCPAFHFFSNLTMAASIYTMCILAVLRFTGLMMPFKTHNSFVTGKHARRRHGFLLIFVAWSLATILCMPTAVFYRLENVSSIVSLNDTEQEASHVTQNCIWENLGTNSHFSFTICLLVMTYLLPGLLISVLYFIVGRELLCYMSKNLQTGHSSGNCAEYWNITRIVFSLVVVFLICWLPYNLYLLFEVVLNNDMDPATKIILKLVGFCFSYVHACINPIIYSFTLSSFQQSVIKTFGLRKVCHLLNRCSIRKLANRRSSITTILSRRQKSRSGDGTLDAKLSSENFLTGERYVADNIELGLIESFGKSEVVNDKCTSSLTY